MRHARIQQAKPERSFAERIVAVIVAIAMLGGMGYATTSAAMADDDGQTLERRAGISLGLHDYTRNAINKNHALKFMSVGDSGTYNRYVGDRKGAYTGIVKTTLTNGYPAMADKGSESLDYLFGGRSDSAVKNYTPAGGLLTLNKEDGYYGFDADFQYAAYNKTSNKFELNPRTYCADQTNTPCFTPFGNDTKDDKYSFGMNLGADFYMPKDGKVNNQDMVFDFTGDDDVWVFIDGVLVLDLGGIHQALGGSINFATGKITYDRTQSYGNRPAAKIDQAFTDAGRTWDSTPYKTHHLSFFYLERGDGGSNCKIRFNLPVKPSKAIDIEKETLGTIDANKQFQFQLFVDDSPTPYQGKYSVYNAYTNQVQSDAQTDNNGVITLTKGQFARVQSDDFTDSTAYRVRELNSSGYTVSANGSPMTQQGSGDSAYAETGSFTVGTTGHVTIVNSNVKPSNNKSIVKTDGGDGDEYTLHLTASGDSTSSTVTTATPADIVLVMDKSGSMDEDDRDSNAKKAANALAGKLLTSQNSALPESQRVRMAVVTFSTNASLKQNFTTDVSEINNAVKGNPKGGTNWEAALKQANDLQGRSGVKKHIIFLSDGNPTYRTSSYGGSCYSYSYSWGGHYTPQPEYTTKATCKAAGYYWRDENPDGGSDGAYGAGDSDDYGFNYAAALAEANKRGDAALYVVKTSTDANKMTDLAREANAVNGEEFDGTNAENLTKAFDQIYSSITSSAKIKVFSITDTLSQWVDPVDFSNATNGADITRHVTVKNGSTVLTSGYAATYSVDSSGNRTVTVTFNGTDGTDGMVAEKTDVIDVSFKVKPSDAAYADYAGNNKYPDTGDADTGDVSAGQPGYYSNADAKLNYCVLTEVNGDTSCEQTEVKYPHPVIRVVSSMLHIEKQWSGEGSKPKSITVDIKQGDDTYKRVTLEPDTDGNWSTDVIIPAGAAKTYTVTETEPENHQWKASYQYKVGNDSFVDGNTVTVPASTASQTATVLITNKQALVTLPANSVSVTKQVIGSTTARDFSFTMVATGDNAKNVTWPKQGQTSSKVTVKDVTSAKRKTALFSDKLTFPARNATYTFQVTEDKPQNTVGWKYDDSTKTVTVTVKYDEQQNKWIATTNPANVAFTNHYIAVSALPLTGGMTDRQWLFVGGVVGGLAVLLIGAAGVWNGKKRLV